MRLRTLGIAAVAAATSLLLAFLAARREAPAPSLAETTPRAAASQGDSELQPAGAPEIRSAPPATADGVDLSLLDAPSTAQRSLARPASGEDTFLLTGTVSLASAPPSVAEVELDVRRIVGAATRLVSKRTVSVGALEPWAIPREGGGTFVLRASAAGRVPLEVALGAPERGGFARVDLVLAEGIAQWFRVTDEDEQPIPGAAVAVAWRAGRRWVQREVLARPDGYIKVEGLPAGMIAPSASAPGHVRKRNVEIVIPPPEATSIWFRLERGVEVRGRCLRAGRPVTDFTVSYWPVDDGEDAARTRAFHGREDGSFELDGVPRESVAFVAADAGSPGSAPVVVDLSSSIAEPLDLQLPQGLMVTGDVVSAGDGAPLEDATVQCFVRGLHGPVTPWGPPIAVDATGRFAVDGLAPGVNTLEVASPGRAARRITVTADASAPVDVGAIALDPFVRFEVALVPPPEGAATGYYVRAKWPGGTAAVPFSQGATGYAALLPEVAPGLLELRLERPDGSTERVMLDVAGAADRQTFRGSGGGTVEFDLQSKEPLAGLIVGVNRIDDRGHEHSRFLGASSGERVSLDLVEPGPARALVFDADEALLASRELTVREGQSHVLLLDLGGAVTTIQVVDGDDQALAGVLVRMRRRGGPVGAPWNVRTTDAAGRAHMGAMERGEYLVHLTHATAGMRFNVPLAIRGEEESTVTLTLDAPSSLRLQFVDGDRIVGGARFHLADRDGEYLSTDLHQANADGVATIEGLAPCEVSIAVLDERLWPDLRNVEAVPGDHLVRVDVRRLGDLAITVRDGDGLPVSKARVELEGDELAETVRELARSGRVESSSDDLLTDGKGTLTVRRLPRGTYRWSVLRGGEPPVTGSVRVEAQFLEKLFVSLP